MKHPAVFISYSTQDQTIAGMVCQALEQEHISCWIAPRNVPIGEKAFEAIPQGVAGCTVLVLILSEKAMQSEYVQRELQLALDYKKIIIPFRIEDIKLDGAVHFMLTGVQWLDAFVPPLERHVAALVNRVAGILDIEKQNISVIQSTYKPHPNRASQRKLSYALLAVCAIVLICIAAYFGFSQTSDASIHNAVVQQLQLVLNPHGILIDCTDCGSSQSHINVQVSKGNVVIFGNAAQADQSLVRGVTLDVRGMHTVSYAISDLSNPMASLASTNNTVVKPSVSAPAAPIAAKPTGAAVPETATPAKALTAEEYRAKAAVLTGQQKMRDQDYVAAENYFRLALNLDPDNQSARAGLESTRKALGEN